MSAAGDAELGRSFVRALAGEAPLGGGFEDGGPFEESVILDGAVDDLGAWQEVAGRLYIRGASGTQFPERRRAAAKAILRASSDPEYADAVDAAWRLGGLMALLRLWGVAGEPYGLREGGL